MGLRKGKLEILLLPKSLSIPTVGVEHFLAWAMEEQWPRLDFICWGRVMHQYVFIERY